MLRQAFNRWSLFVVSLWIWKWHKDMNFKLLTNRNTSSSESSRPQLNLEMSSWQAVVNFSTKRKSLNMIEPIFTRNDLHCPEFKEIHLNHSSVILPSFITLGNRVRVFKKARKFMAFKRLVFAFFQIFQLFRAHFFSSFQKLVTFS